MLPEKFCSSHVTLRVLFIAKFTLSMLNFNMNSLFEGKEIKSAFGGLFTFLMYTRLVCLDPVIKIECHYHGFCL